MRKPTEADVPVVHHHVYGVDWEVHLEHWLRVFDDICRFYVFEQELYGQFAGVGGSLRGHYPECRRHIAEWSNLRYV